MATFLRARISGIAARCTAVGSWTPSSLARPVWSLASTPPQNVAGGDDVGAAGEDDGEGSGSPSSGCARSRPSSSVASAWKTLQVCLLSCIGRTGPTGRGAGPPVASAPPARGLLPICVVDTSMSRQKNQKKQLTKTHPPKHLRARLGASRETREQIYRPVISLSITRSTARETSRILQSRRVDLAA